MQPIQNMLTIVTGPPCSGKSVYVREHAQPGDIVIDFDTIAAALGSPVTHGHDPVFLTVATVARRAAIEVVLAGIDRPAWIIDSKLHPMRKRMYAAAGAHFVTMSVARAELHRRAHAAGRPDICHELIDAPHTRSRNW